MTFSASSDAVCNENVGDPCAAWIAVIQQSIEDLR
jgi:hypothetical protein